MYSFTHPFFRDFTYTVCRYSLNVCPVPVYAHQVQYKKGHEERVTQFTSITDSPEIMHAKTGAALASDVSTTTTHYIG